LAFTIGEDREIFLWGHDDDGRLSHGDTQDQPLLNRVEALRVVRVSSVSVRYVHAVALTEEGLVYAWSENTAVATLGNPHVEMELLPKPIEALRGVRVVGVAATVIAAMH
jgi:alpha-tubulin suppressor-like RCC1 family protein